MNRAPGIDVSAAKTAAEALSIARLDWKVEAQPLFALAAGRAGVDDGVSRYVDVGSHKAIVRATDSMVLGVVGNNYRPVQNEEMFDISNILARDEGVKFARAGSFDGGSRLFLSLELPGMIRLGDDTVQKYLTLINSHDGTSALHGLINAVRLWCTNQLPNLLRRGWLKKNNTDQISIRHTQSADEKLVQAREALGQAMGFYRAYEQVASRLFEARFSTADMFELAAQIFPAPANSSAPEGIPTQVDNKRNTLVTLFEAGTGHRETGIVGTAWAALNAVSEYVDHVRGTRVRKGSLNDANDQRTVSAWFGSGAVMKAKAFDLIADKVGIKAALN